MASLFNTRISDTYSGLIKTIDNAAITASLKEITDGNGTGTGLFVNTAGDFKVTAILEFGSLKDTGENITITKFVDEADGIANNDNDTTIPTTAAIIDYVAAQITIEDLDFTGDSGSGQIDLDSQIFAINGTANEITTVASGQSITFSLNSAGVVLPNNSTATTQTAGDNSTKIATTSYVDTLDAASDLDFSGDSGTGDVNLNTQVFAITGTANQIESTASGQGLSLQFPSAGVTLPNGSVATTQASSDDSTKVATTAYVKGLNNASDLDFTTDSGSGAVVLNSQTLSVLGTTNEIETSGSGQAVTIGLPSTINVNVTGNLTGNVTGNVTGDLTGNSDTATKWQTARDLSLTGQATGTISSVDGSANVSGAVTLDNNSVTAKVLTGLTSPSASSVLATDTILEGFGKVQSQINGLAGGLRFMGDWNATTNSPVLSSGGGEAANGTTTSTTANKLVDSSASFTSTVTVGDQVVNQVDGQTALVSNVDSDTTLSLSADIMLTGEAYTIDNSPFITQGHYYVVSVGGTTSLNGVSNWSVGDWVIAGANNQWTKLDHSQVDGTGTAGNLTKWASTSVIADSIVSESGTAITVDGSLATNSFLSSTGNFSVNTDKFTVAASSGNTAFTGDLAINTDKFTVNATSGNVVVAGTGTFAGNVTINGLVIGTDQTFAGEYRTFAFGTNANGYNRIFATKDQTDGIYLASATGHGLKVRVNGNSTNVLTIDSSGNATFAGNLTAVRGIFNSGTTNNVASFTSTDATAKLQCVDNAGLVNFGANGDDFIVQPAGGTTQFTVGSSSSTFAGDVTLSSASSPTLEITDTTNTCTFKAYAQNSNAHIGTMTNHSLVIDTNGSSALTIDSSQNATFAGQVLIASGEYLSWGTSGTTAIEGSTVSNKLAFFTQSTERMRIDSSGNVGIGTSSPASKFEVYGGNSGVNDVDRYIRFKASNGEKRFDFYVGGTGNASSLGMYTSDGTTKNVQISAGGISYFNAGNVGIGTTSPVSNCEISDSTQATGATLSITNAHSGSWASGDKIGSIDFRIDDASATEFVRARIHSEGLTTGTFPSNSELVFSTANANTLSERMRIDSSGNSTFTGDVQASGIYVGATNASFDFYNQGTSYFNGAVTVDAAFTQSGGDASTFSGDVIVKDATQASKFETSGNDLVLTANSGQSNVTPNIIFKSSVSGGALNEKMRITSGGSLSINTGSSSTNSYPLEIEAFSGGAQIKLKRSAAFTDMFMGGTTSSGTEFFIRSAGTGGVKLAAAATAWASASDESLKENIKPLENVLDKIKDYRCVEYNFKTDNNKKIGFIAQDWENDFTPIIDKNEDGILSMKYTETIPVLLKAIQELKAEVDKLKQECKCK